MNHTPGIDKIQQDSIDELGKTAFFMIEIQQKLEKVSTQVIHASEQIIENSQLFAEMVKKREAIDQQMRYSLNQTIQETTKQASHPIETLKRATHEATEYITAYQEALIASLYWRWGSLIVIALFGGLLSGLIIQPYLSKQTLTEAQWKQLEAGKALLNAWDKLNHTEQQKILAFDVDQKIFQTTDPNKPKQVNKKTVSPPMRSANP